MCLLGADPECGQEIQVQTGLRQVRARAPPQPLPQCQSGRPDRTWNREGLCVAHHSKESWTGGHLARLAPASRGVLSGDGWLSIVPSTALGGGGVAWSLGSSGASLGFPRTLSSP